MTSDAAGGGNPGREEGPLKDHSDSLYDQVESILIDASEPFTACNGQGRTTET